jgi:hypothetical protein
VDGGGATSGYERATRWPRCLKQLAVARKAILRMPIVRVVVQARTASKLDGAKSDDSFVGAAHLRVCLAADC